MFSVSGSVSLSARIPEYTAVGFHAMPIVALKPITGRYTNQAEKNQPHHGKAAAQRIHEIQGSNIRYKKNTQVRIVLVYLFVFGNTRPRIAVLRNNAVVYSGHS